MNRPLRLFLVRHGETAWSITGQHTGLTDIALTAHGEDEARALAPRLRTTSFARILTSPLRRARLGRPEHALPDIEPLSERAFTATERGARLDQKDVLWHGTPAGWAEHEGKLEIERYLRSLEERGEP